MTTDKMTTIHYEKLIDASPVQAQPGILNPLRFLLAARRGIETDPSLPPNNLPLDSGLGFRGESGLQVPSRRCAQLVCDLGRSEWYVKIFMAGLIGMLGSPVTAIAMLGLTFAGVRWPSPIINNLEGVFLLSGVIIAVAVLVFLCVAGVVAKRHDAAAIAPEFDPESYQSRLVAAMRQAGLQYAELVTAEQQDTDKGRSQHGGLREKFTIHGLVDPVDSQFVHDVTVRFFAKGQVWIQFGSESYAQPATLISRGHTQPVLIVPQGEKK